MFNFRTFSIFSFMVTLCLCEERLLIDHLRWNFFNLEDQLWEMALNSNSEHGIEKWEQDLVKGFTNINKEMKQMPQDLYYGIKPLRTNFDFPIVYAELQTIDRIYDKFEKFLNEYPKNNGISIEDLSYDIFNNKSGVQVIINKIHEIAYEQKDSLVENLTQMLHREYQCKTSEQSPQQLFYNLYNSVGLRDLKVYILQQFIYLFYLETIEITGTKLKFSRDKYRKTIDNIIKNMTMVFENPRDIWKCDPKTFIKGKNYDEFTRLLQGYIENEVDMSRSRSCRQTCDYYSFTENYGCYDYKSTFCRKNERCSEKIFGCFFVESYASMCFSDVALRRYDYIRYKSGETLGKTKYCPASNLVNSWQRWFVRCHYCVCLCDEQGPLSDRYISLRPVTANVENNSVVTGIRFIKKNRILHLQIQEGKLLSHGYIDQSTVHWVDVDDFKITDEDITSGQDFFTMSFGDASMTMDEIEVKTLHVVTGVQLKIVDNSVQLSLHVTPFNWLTGTLNLTESFQIFDSPSNKRTKFNIKNADVPILTTDPSKMHESAGEKYVEFTHTDFGKDMAQTTIPFIDIQEVASSPAVPLAGVGIYYKGNNGYGGFIAPRITTYDYSKHLNKLKSVENSDHVEKIEIEIN
ncbi:hypothetical protein ABEB36_008421 [Hypothenemus hampei]|uniref:Uncharacterized protein n=1 Tax=Hypothenemus hampei TaxID=57062 RepID=A0ABD1ELS2_HYPHA